MLIVWHFLCCPRKKSAGRKAELKGGERKIPGGIFDPTMSEVKSMLQLSSARTPTSPF